MRLTAAVTREGKWYVAQCLEIDVASQGDTIEAALANLREAVELRLEDEPQPLSLKEAPIIAPLEVTPKPSAA
jgi:predicted RNase H-like HicB family nuclease